MNQRVLRAFPTLLRVGFAATIAYRAEFLIWMLTMTMPLVSLALWTAVSQEGAVSGYNPARFADYFLLILVVRQLTGSWANWALGEDIRQGTLSLKLLRPIHPIFALAGEALSSVPLRIFFSFPVALIAFLFVEGSWEGESYASLAVLSLIGAWCCTFFVSVVLGTSAFWLESQNGPFLLWQGFYSIFSGYIVPLDLFPDWLQRVAHLLPFRYFLSFPVEVMVGKLSLQEILLGLGLQWVYVAVFLLLSLLLFRAGIRRFEAYGA